MPESGSGGVVCSCSLLVRRALSSPKGSSFALIALFRFPEPPLFSQRGEATFCKNVPDFLQQDFVARRRMGRSVGWVLRHFPSPDSSVSPETKKGYRSCEPSSGQTARTEQRIVGRVSGSGRHRPTDEMGSRCAPSLARRWRQFRRCPRNGRRDHGRRSARVSASNPPRRRRAALRHCTVSYGKARLVGRPLWGSSPGSQARRPAWSHARLVSRRAT